MLTWFNQRVGTTWSRRTRWSALLENQREFQRTLTKERCRVDRTGSCFGLIILRLVELEHAKPQVLQLAKLLHRRLRDSDEKGHLGFGRIGVMLPDTASLETDFVLNDILKLAGEVDLKIEGEAFVYPERKSRSGSGQGSETQVESDAEVDSVALGMMLPEYPRWKRAIDVAGAVVGLVLSAPCLLLFAALIKATSPGPVLFCQERTGYLGVPFKIFKLRTMVINAEELKANLHLDNERDGPAFKIRNDPRITRIGRFLRATGLDELPQLLNVVRGEMSLVGPRPLPVSEATQCSGWQKRRQEIKPGLTCFWQLAKSRKMSFADWMRLDLHYVRGTSMQQDIQLLLRTVFSVVLGRVGH